MVALNSLTPATLGGFLSQPAHTVGPGGIERRTEEKQTLMDFNLAVLSGTLAATPEIREFESGTRLARYLITTRVDEPRKRTDVVPVVLWDPPDEIIDQQPQIGRRVFVCASVQRRFWSVDEERRSRLELVAEIVRFRPAQEEAGQ